MRLAAAAACAILLAAHARADDKPKPNTLTADDLAKGYVNLFDGESTFGWKVEGTAAVKDGKLVVGGDKDTTLTSTTSFPLSSLRREFETTDGNPAKGGRLLGPNGHVVVNFKDVAKQKSTSPTGEVGVGAPFGPVVIEVPAGQQIAFSVLAIRPGGFKPLFDGKTLDGWKVNAADPKRMASKFEVTKDGELAVKNGPGDLVTDKEFDNFVLQFECKTLGDGLNSGFFFRCIPGQYQNGYEAQVQNSYLDNDRTKPKDFGTGAIYRRIASRKVVSNDKEWFTMTVVADGKHIATWVNGYQTVDWTDDRKESDNPRQGYRAAKGPISIQGHDPTTDLLFRNIRVGEFPVANKKD